MAIDWSEIREPGSYLHLASGLIARVYADDVEVARAGSGPRGGGPVVCLLANPAAPLSLLRDIAERHGLRVNA